MKVYISCDIEGIATLSSFEEADPSGEYFKEMTTLLSKEVAAACRGAIKGGATSITVDDFHAYGKNISAEYLPKEVKILRGVSNDVFGVTSLFDDSYDGIMYVGHHDFAGSNGNPAAHTMSSAKIFEIRVNGKVFSEFDILSNAAANLGVPSIFISGDKGICDKARESVSNIRTVVTKVGRGNSVLSMTPEKSIEEIEKSAEEALRNLKDIKKIQLNDEFDVEITYIRHFNAYKNSHYPNAFLKSPNTVGFKTNDYREVMRFFFFCI